MAVIARSSKTTIQRGFLFSAYMFYFVQIINLGRFKKQRPVADRNYAMLNFNGFLPQQYEKNTTDNKNAAYRPLSKLSLTIERPL
ncbi:hypothetical protein [Mucilaginibacter pedocola]|uniref:hypothetical protein n=1 Tax=Mucilaginibacter pedocola TaxID=1792845 RepID=UPI00117E9B89|nr:hypothetical protein [Mucilaginibacter pedocola]